MSLLLEALKKAEKAKEEAQRRAKGADASEAQFDGEATLADPPGRRVLTRHELPDISQPLEILSDDLQQAPQSAPPITLESRQEEQAARPPMPRPAPAPAPAAEPSSTQAKAAERAAAQKVFEAKFKEPDPRLPFFIAMGALGVFAFGTVGYFWYQLRPPPALVSANPQRPAGERPVAVASEQKAVEAPGAKQAAAEPEVPGLPGSPAAPASAPVPVAAAPAATPAPAAATPAAAKPAPIAAAEVSKPVAPAASAKPATRPEKLAATPARARPARTSADAERAVSVRRGAPQIHPRVEAGYAAYQGGDLPVARAAYEQALREEPDNRDALLGLAAVELRAQRFELAEAHYQRLLRADPRDPYAHAGLLALRGQQIDPVFAESRVKTLLAADPDQSALQFTLGNQYAQQERWAEAQQAYFRAHSADPENPDFAFNLAVSLDQLRQPKLALEYYRRALVLADKRAPSFSPDAVRARLQELVR